MKKILSIILSLTMVISLFILPFTAFAADNRENKKINSFINGITKLSREYDADKDFEVKEEQAAPFSIIANENTSPSQEYTDIDFQTARLIVRADGKFDTFGAKEHISGFEDFHILQYESPEAAISAYEKYKTMSEIKNVAPDEVVDCLQGEQREVATTAELSNDGHLCDWSRDRTQSKRLQECFKELNVSNDTKVVVGVIDTGVDYNHNFLKNRIERTYFNSSSDGTPNDEMDNEINCHGTAVSSVIVDNSPENVKVAVYRVVANDGKTSTVSQICAGYLQAIEDKVDVISVSLGHGDQSGMAEACVLQAYSNQIPFFVAIGNSGMQDIYTLPANIPECITVSATDRNNTVTLWSTLSVNTDISAPGEDIPVAVIHNGYEVWSGTSFSAPCAAALGAIMKAVYPDITVDQMEARLKETSIDVKLYNYYESVQGSNMDNYYSLWDGVGMIQFCNALGLEKLTAPEIDLEDKVYVGEKDCTITCSDENAIILYTTDGTYPALENATIYTKPFKITQRTRIRAVAYYTDSGYYSDEVEVTPRIQYIDSDKNYVIDNDGIIKNYSGNITDLYVPDIINGITVTGFIRGAFDTVIGLTLPETVKEIPEAAFYQTQLEYICAKGALSIAEYAFAESNIIYGEFPQAKVIGEYAFQKTYPLCSVDFPSAETIKRGAFYRSGLLSFFGPNVKTSDRIAFEQCTALEIVQLPKLTEFNHLAGSFGEFDGDESLVIVEMPLVQNLLSRAFRYTKISNADFPFVTEMYFGAFYDCPCLEYINMPALLSVPKQAFGASFHAGIKKRFFRLDSVTQIEQDAFGTYETSRIEFSHLETAKSLPQTKNCIIAMPSTFTECTENTAGRNYKVYGTKGTYAEQWANENGHEFIEVSQETALFQDVPMEYAGEEPLAVDVIGFNRTYQWYSNTEADNTTGTPIEGATDKEFNPADYPASPYYYCVVTSTDVGYDSVEIRTGVTANKAVSADYAKVYEAIGQIPEDLSVYTEESVSALQEVLDSIDYNLGITEQANVDAYAEAIKKAINELELSVPNTEPSTVPNTEPSTKPSTEPTPTPEKIYVLLGDMNSDGKTTVLDAKILLRALVNSTTLDERQRFSADVNQDGKISVVDAKRILQIVADMGKAETVEIIQ